MAIWNRKTPAPAVATGIIGTLRSARNDKDVSGLRPGDIALVNQSDLDGQIAGALIDRNVGAVINVGASRRVPSIGPQMLSKAGIALIHIPAGGESELKGGDRVRIESGRVFKNDRLIATGEALDHASTVSAFAAAESTLATRLDSLAANAADHIQREHAMLMDGASVPRVRTKLRNRPVVVVSRGHDASADLAGLRRYIAENDPVLIGAGTGADLLIDAGYEPRIVIGALDNLSDRAIRSAGEVVVTSASGRLEMPERLERHGKAVSTFASTGSDDDLAILLADTNEAEVIVHVGGPANLSQFLDGAPTDVARMFVARLRVGAKIVDAKAVHHFSTQRLALWPIALLFAAAVIAVAAAVAVTPVGHDWFGGLNAHLGDLRIWIKGLFT